MSEIKLKSCPFCGGEAYFPTVTETWIRCKSCGFETPYTEDKEWLVNTWNTRKPIEKIVEQLEEHFNATDDRDARLAYHHAIEIVKRGITDDVCEWHKVKNGNAYKFPNIIADVMGYNTEKASTDIKDDTQKLWKE